MRVSELFAESIGKRVCVEVKVAGEQIQKALPRTIKVSCSKCGEEITVDTLYEKKMLQDLIFGAKSQAWERARLFFTINHGKDCPSGGQHALSIEEADYTDFSILFCRDRLENIGKFDQRKYRPRPIYLVGQRLPDAKDIAVEGDVILDRRNNDIVILADRAEPLESEVMSFTITDRDKEDWPKYFNNGAEVWRQIAPHIVGERRALAKKAYSLALHSPAVIPDTSGKLIRGVLHVAFFGGTKLGKSEIACDPTEEGTFKHGYHLGEYIDVGTASRSGLLYVIDSDNRILTWGVLPMNDMGLVVLDNLQAIDPNELNEYREVLETMKVKVRRLEYGDAWARVRQIVCLNPNRNELEQYIHACEGIPDSRPFSQTPDLTRWDLFIPFKSRDVSAHEIAYATPEPRPVPDEVYHRHVLWVWSRRPEQIAYTDEAKEKIREEAKRLIDLYSLSVLPVVHNGISELLCRLSVAKAAEAHSTDESQELVIVKKEHVEEVVAFYEKVLEALEFPQYKAEVEGKTRITDSEFGEIMGSLDKDDLDILDEIIKGARTSAVIAEKLHLSEPTVKRHYEKLRAHDLIKATPGKGVELTLRGVALARKLIGLDVDLSQQILIEKILALYSRHNPDGRMSKDEFKQLVLTQTKSDEKRIDEAINHLAERGKLFFAHTDVKEQVSENDTLSLKVHPPTPPSELNNNVKQGQKTVQYTPKLKVSTNDTNSIYSEHIDSALLEEVVNLYRAHKAENLTRLEFFRLLQEKMRSEPANRLLEAIVRLPKEYTFKPDPRDDEIFDSFLDAKTYLEGGDSHEA
jgi:DNA-binding Lrp family transcriptional regulator